MLELLGALGGGLFRLAPEVLNWVDKKDARKHELALLDHQIKLADAQGASAIAVEEVKALAAGAAAQSTQTGVAWVDAVNALIRPIITIWWTIVLYTGALIAQFNVLVAEGAQYASAIVELWGPTEKAIACSIISFWFVDRAIRQNNVIKGKT